MVLNSQNYFTKNAKKWVKLPDENDCCLICVVVYAGYVYEKFVLDHRYPTDFLSG